MKSILLLVVICILMASTLNTYVFAEDIVEKDIIIQVDSDPPKKIGSLLIDRNKWDLLRISDQVKNIVTKDPNGLIFGFTSGDYLAMAKLGEVLYQSSTTKIDDLQALCGICEVALGRVLVYSLQAIEATLGSASPYIILFSLFKIVVKELLDTIIESYPDVPKVSANIDGKPWKQFYGNTVNVPVNTITELTGQKIGQVWYVLTKNGIYCEHDDLFFSLSGYGASSPLIITKTFSLQDEGKYVMRIFAVSEQWRTWYPLTVFEQFLLSHWQDGYQTFRDKKVGVGTVTFDVTHKQIPIVTNTSPDVDAKVSVNTNRVNITFNKPMMTQDPNGISPIYFTTLVSMSSPSNIERLDNPVWANGNTVLSFDIIGLPDQSPLQYSTTYTITCKDGIKDQDGIALDGNGDGQPGGDYVWSFRTEEGCELEVIPAQKSLSDWEKVDHVIRFTNNHLPLTGFSGKVYVLSGDPAWLYNIIQASSFTFLLGPGQTIQTPQIPGFSVTNNSRPLGSWIDIAVEVEVQGGTIAKIVRDMSGEAFLVTSTSPEHEASGVSVDRDIMIGCVEFSSDIDPNLDLQNMLSISPNNNGEEITNVQILSSKSLAFEVSSDFPDRGLQYRTNYTITVSRDMKSASGAMLDGNENGIPGEENDHYSWKFTTEEVPFDLTVTPPVNTAIGPGSTGTHNVTLRNCAIRTISFEIDITDGSGGGWVVTGSPLSTGVSLFGDCFGEWTHTISAQNVSANSAWNCTITVTATALGTTASSGALSLGSQQSHVWDHPDDAASVSSSGYPTPWLVDSKSKIGVLMNGWGYGLGHLLGKYQTATAVVKPDLGILGEPDLSLNDLSVLLIGSAGLEGLDSSPTFREQLEEFVSQGGVLVVFTTKRGYEWQALPGGQVEGYGWDEDQSCQRGSVYIENYHQVLSGQDSLYLTVNVDGYFMRWPDNATVLLTRSKNRMPAMIMYPYGQGWVVASTAYTDWGYGHWQSTEDGRTLVRDTVAWAMGPKQLPEFSPGDDVEFSFDVKNDSIVDAAQIKLVTLDPDRKFIKEETIAQAVAAGETGSMTYQLPIVERRLGIWYVHYTLLDSDGNPVQDEGLGERFVVSDPPADVVAKRDITFSVVTDAECYPYGSEVEFTVFIWNNTDNTRYMKCKFQFPHHRQYPSYWLTTEVPANSETSLKFTSPPQYRREDIIVSFYDEISGKYLGYAMHGYYVYSLYVTVHAKVDKDIYGPGENASISLSLQNKIFQEYTATVKTFVTDPNDVEVFEDSREVKLPAEGTAHEDIVFTLPTDSAVGSYRVGVEVFRADTKIGAGCDYFKVPEGYITATSITPGVLSGMNTFSFSLQPRYIYNMTGSLETSLEAPDGSIIWTESKDFEITEGQMSTVDFEPSIAYPLFGEYKLAYTLTYGQKTVAGERIFSCSSLLKLDFDKPWYRIRGTMGMDMEITNNGQALLENAALNVSIPDMGYSYSEAITLSPNQSTSLSLPVAIPETLSAGAHQVIATLSLNNSITEELSFFIPESQLVLILDQLNYDAGDPVSVGIENVGGVDTAAEYTINMSGRGGVNVLEASGTMDLQASTPSTIDFIIPQSVINGGYSLVVNGLDLSTGRYVRITKGIQVSGLIADLEVDTDKEIYRSSEARTAFSNIQVSHGDIEDGMLKLQVFQRYTHEQRKTWTTQSDWESGELHRVDTISSPGDVIIDPGSGTTLDLVWETIGSAQAVTTEGDYAYLCTEHRLLVLDISDPSSPVEVARVAASGIKIQVFEGYAYVLEKSGFRVIDVHNPTNPYEVSYYDVPGASDMYVTGTYVCIATYGQLVSVDISDPSNPQYVGTHTPYVRYPPWSGPWINAVSVFGEYAYLSSGYEHNGMMTDYDGYFEVVDISDMSRVGLYHTYTEWSDHLYASNNYLYEIIGSHLSVIDISDPTNLQGMGGCDIGSPASGLFVAGGYAYITGSNEEIRVVDVSDPANPHLAATWNTPSTPSRKIAGIYVAQDHAYVIDGYNGLQVLDISDLMNPVEVEFYPILGSGKKKICMSEDRAYVANGVGRGFHVIDVSNPEDSREIGFCEIDIPSGAVITRTHVFRNYAYVFYYTNVAPYYGFGVIDISDPTEPCQIWYNETDFPPTFCLDGYVYVPDAHEGFRIMDISNPSKISEVGFYTSAYNWCDELYLMGIYVLNGYAYLVGYYMTNGMYTILSSFLEIVDVSDPTNPSLEGIYEFAFSDTQSVYVTGEYAYILATESYPTVNSRLLVIDVSDPSNPHRVGVYSLNQYASRICVVGECALLVIGNKVLMIDVSDPTNPREIGFLDSFESIREIYPSGDYVYLTDSGSGLYILQYAGYSWLSLKFDAGGEAKWESVSWSSDEPEGTDIKAATRTADSEEGLPRAMWSEYYTESGAAITSAPNQWIEVKVALESSDPATITPVLHDLCLDYLVAEPVWEQSIPVDVTDIYTVSKGLEPFEGAGKFILKGTLYSQLSQVIDTDSEVFYIDDGDIHLTFQTDRNVYKPNQTISVAGEVSNDSSVPATGLHLVIEKSDGTVLYEDTMDVAVGGSYGYSFDIPAPDESFTVEGSLDGIQMSEAVKVEEPTLDVAFQHPAIAGREPFSFDVELVNPTGVDVDVNVDIGGESGDLTVPAGTSQLVQRTLSITGDSVIDVILSGDVNTSYHRNILFGESAQVNVNPEAVYPEGSVVIPYTVENTGSLDVQFDLSFSLAGHTETRSVFVPVEGTFSDTLVYDLTAGQYTLSYQSFFGSDSVGFKVARYNYLEMNVDAQIISMPSVLILKGGGMEGDFNTILTEANAVVTVSPVYEYEWDGTNPSPSDFDAVVLLNTEWTDMPFTGQTALVDYVNAGGGLIIAGWITRDNRYYGHYASMTDLLLFDPNQWDQGAGPGTFSVVQEHPVTAGLPAAFAVPDHMGNKGGVNPDVTVLVTDSVLNDVVAVKEYGEGRIVQFALSGENGEFASCEEMKALLANSVNWAAHAKEDKLLVSVNISNAGYNDFDGQLGVDADFYSNISDLSLNAGETKTVKYDFDLVAIKPGVYEFVASAMYLGNVVQQAETEIEIPGAAFELTSKPDNPVYMPGEEAKMSFKVKNVGKGEGQAEVRLTVLDMMDETRMVWIAPDAEEEMDFTFVVWDDLPENTYKAEFQLDGVTTDIPFTVQGISIAVSASLDKPLYNIGDTAVLTLEITNESDLYPEMFAVAKCGDYEGSQEFTLAQSNTLQFSMPVDESTSDYIAYGIYLDSGRAVHLNTIYIRLSGDIISLYTDKCVYLQGELVTAFVQSSQSGTLSVAAPGFAGDIDITGSDSFDFLLPGELASGTYSIDWIFGEGSGFCNFDVIGYAARIMECRLDKEIYDPIDFMNIFFRIEVNHDIPGILKGWLLDATGNYSELFETSRPFAKGENRITVDTILSTPYSGTHRVVYALYKGPDEMLLASGAESFDVRAVALTGLATLKSAYERDEDVQAKVNAFASAEFSGYMRLSVDGAEVIYEPVTLTGYREFTYSLGAFGLGEHSLSAELMSDSTVISQREASFTVEDTIPPANPSGLSAMAEGSIAILGWNANSEPDLKGYHVYRNASRLTVVPVARTGYRDERLVANTDFVYYVTAVDELGNESGPSNMAQLGVDSIPPVIAISPPSDITSDEPVTMTYSVTDNVDPNPTVTANYPSPTTFDKFGVYTVNVAAADFSGNTSRKSVTITIEITIPEPITTLSASDPRIGGAVDLDWTGYMEEDQQIALYNVYYSESDFADVTGMMVVATVPAGTFSYRVTGLENDKRYYFAVTPVNMAVMENTSVQTASAIPTCAGDIAISSVPPGARAYLGGNYGYMGEYKGETPLTIYDLPLGKYVVRLALAGYESSYHMVEVHPGATTELNVTLIGRTVPQYTRDDILKDANGAPLHPSGNALAPFVVDWNMDGARDILIGDAAGQVFYYENIGTDEMPEFSVADLLMWGLNPNIAVFAVDWDNDGKKDLIVGDGPGNVTVYLNTWTDPHPAFEDGGTVIISSMPGINFAIPWVVDWDNDHDKDLLVGDGNGAVNLFVNVGTDPIPVFEEPVRVMVGGAPMLVDGGNAAPCVLDWDGDGRKDLLAGCKSGELYLYLNTGTDESPAFTAGMLVKAYDSDLSVGEHSIPFVVDWDNDDLTDMVIGSGDGLIHLFLVLPIINAGPDMRITDVNQASARIVGVAFDQDDDPLTYRWLEGETELLGSTPVEGNGLAPLDLGTIPPLSLGDHVLTLEVSDGKHVVTDDMVLTVALKVPDGNMVLKPEVLRVNPGILTAFVVFPEPYSALTITDATCDGAPLDRLNFARGEEEAILQFRRSEMTEVPLDIYFVVQGTFLWNGVEVPFEGFDSIMEVLEY